VKSFVPGALWFCYTTGVTADKVTSKGLKKIDELAAILEKSGGDAQRLEVLKRTQKFKRSWVDLAEVLTKVRNSQAFKRWGFTDFYSYACEELALKKPTVDKLVLSYSTLRSHAPEVLKWDGVAKVIPSYEAVNYYSQVLPPADDEAGEQLPRPRRKVELVPPAADVLAEMKTAVFDEGKAVTELRKRFDPVLYPKPKGAAKLEVIKKANNAARKLAELLPDIDGLSDKLARNLERELGVLRTELTELAAPLEEQVARAQKRTRAKAPKLRAVNPQ